MVQFNRNIMWAIYIILVFLMNIFFKSKKVTSEINFNIIFYLTPYSQMLSFQHVISIKLFKIFYILFWYCGSKIWCMLGAPRWLSRLSGSDFGSDCDLMVLELSLWTSHQSPCCQHRAHFRSSLPLPCSLSLSQK